MNGNSCNGPGLFCVFQLCDQEPNMRRWGWGHCGQQGQQLGRTAGSGAEDSEDILEPMSIFVTIYHCTLPACPSENSGCCVPPIFQVSGTFLSWPMLSWSRTEMEIPGGAAPRISKWTQCGRGYSKKLRAGRAWMCSQGPCDGLFYVST